jgi:hypothetical protein
LQLHVADTLAFCATQYEGREDHPQGTADHGRQQRHEVLAGIQAQRGNSPCRGAAPGRHATHDAQRQHGDGCQDHRVHADAFIQRQHCGAGDHVGRCAVAVERYQQRQQGRAYGDLHRVAIDPLQDFADQRVEQACVDHQAEEQDRKQQQRGRRGDHFQAVEHHLASGAAKAADHREDDGNHGERDDGRQALRHDEIGEYDHHGQAKESEHRTILLLLS